MEKNDTLVRRTVDIEEYFSKEGDDVYLNWRFLNYLDGEWNRKLTPYKEIPYVKVNFDSLNKK